MNINFTVGNESFTANTDKPLDISIPLIFNGSQPNIYGAPIARSKACEIGDFIGDTRQGGSCNFDEYSLISHCNGTHTECVGHITNERISIQNVLKDIFIPSVLISIAPQKAGDSNDTYDPPKNDDDMLVTKSSIKSALKEFSKGFVEGLLIRTLPNDNSKKSRAYMEKAPSFLSIEAAKYIHSIGVKHLLLDLPSVDRTFDEGKLSVHHIYWNVKQGSHDVDPGNYSLKTITEMIYVPDEIPDGKYLLNLQIAPFVSDASPSRPILFEVK
jgi:kynurenine formamidase